jgi:hypothetical protein
MDKRSSLTAHRIWAEKRIYWVTTYQSVLKYVQLYKDILKPVTVGTKTGKRYFISEENLKNFIELFENNKLKK